jgi:acyl carrier protein
LTKPAPEPVDAASLVSFGPRWDNVTRVSIDPAGAAERLVELSLPADFRTDLADCRVHPALLDNATAEAAVFDPGYPHLPFLYQRFELYGRLPAEIVSHVRGRPGPVGTVAADVDLYATDGRLLARITGFTMRRVRPDGFSGDADVAGGPEGIDPGEGARLFLSLLGARHPYQVAVRPHVAGRPTSIVDTPEVPAGPRAAGPQSPPAVAPDPPSAPGAPGAMDLRDQLAAIWREVLGTPAIRGDDDFFELGGNSLTAVELMSRIKEVFGVQLSVIVMFDHPTLTSFGDALLAEASHDDQKASLT